MSQALLQTVREFLGRLSAPPGPVVVAVSGGPDSVALLWALLAIRVDPAARPLIIAHFNHRLRGAESDADEAFVTDLHAARCAAGVTHLLLRHERLEVATVAREQRQNLEDTARRLRYDWLARVAQETGARWVATGHTADDQAETVLHRLLRGTGLRGLRGIAERRPLMPGVELIRPLLRVSRQDVLDYLEGEGQAYRIDRSNADLSFTRNRIRQELLPFLAAKYSPAIGSLLCRLAEQAEEVYRHVEAEAGQLLAEAELPRAGAVLVFDRRRLAEAPRHLVREALRLAWARESWPEGHMAFEDWDRLAAVALSESAVIHLPGGIRACGRGRVVQIGPAW
ncbi:MAG TPA: tRNA lysidine(34) synthetase TilS [Gemmataceae bacterium]|nr:tRNA lysidine(34) synthetase TilS [Gemmataceae bacterium]